MATRNPFGQLRVARDEDEEVPQVVSKPATTTPIFTNTQAAEQKKKKKVRPEDKKRSDEPVQESNEGFEVVGKPKPPRHQRKHNPSEEEDVSGEGQIKEDKHANKLGLAHHAHNVRPVRAGKRQFERHSGTGRGKETAKNGAGAKTVWGDNPEFIAKQSMREDISNDKFFDYALNPKPKRAKEEMIETPVAEETPAAEETPKAEETPAQEEQTEERRKRPVPEEKPINPEDLLDIPENALSLAEYREQLKEKNRKILGSTGNAQLNVQLPSDLKKLEKESFGVKAPEKKPAAKPAKKENAVQEIAVAFKTEDSGFQSRGDRGDYIPKKKSKPAPKIRFEDLPSL